MFVRETRRLRDSDLGNSVSFSSCATRTWVTPESAFVRLGLGNDCARDSDWGNIHYHGARETGTRVTVCTRETRTRYRYYRMCAAAHCAFKLPVRLGLGLGRCASAFGSKSLVILCCATSVATREPCQVARLRVLGSTSTEAKSSDRHGARLRVSARESGAA